MLTHTHTRSRGSPLLKRTGAFIYLFWMGVEKKTGKEIPEVCITCTVPVPPSTAMLVSDAMRAEIDGREDRAKAEAAQQARDAAAATAAIEAERDAAAAAAAAMLATPTHDFASMAGGGLVKPCAFSNHRCNCSRGVVWCVCVRV